MQKVHAFAGEFRVSREQDIDSLSNAEYWIFESRAPRSIIWTCFAVETDHQWFRLLGVDAERRKRRVVYPKRDEAMMKLRKIYA